MDKSAGPELIHQSEKFVAEVNVRVKTPEKLAKKKVGFSNLATKSDRETGAIIIKVVRIR